MLINVSTVQKMLGKKGENHKNNIYRTNSFLFKKGTYVCVYKIHVICILLYIVYLLYSITFTI